MSYCLQSVQCTGKHVHCSNINRWNASYRIFLINSGRAEYMQAVGGRIRPTGLPGIYAGSRRSYRAYRSAKNMHRQQVFVYGL